MALQRGLSTVGGIGRTSTPEEVNVAAAALEDYGWLRLEKVETGGRPTTQIRLHPSLRGSA